jgi:hypothetical protein
VASTLAANVAVDHVSRGMWLVVADGLQLGPQHFLGRGTIHKPMWVHLLPQIMVRPR